MVPTALPLSSTFIHLPGIGRLREREHCIVPRTTGAQGNSIDMG